MHREDIVLKKKAVFLQRNCANEGYIQRGCKTRVVYTVNIKYMDGPGP